MGFGSDSKIIKLAVIGAGPVGLAFIVELLSKAYAHPHITFEVHVIEKRDLHFTRGQKIILIQDESLNKGITWIDFIKKHFFPGQNVALNKKGDLLIDENIPEQQDARYNFLQKILRQQDKSELPVNVSIKQLQNNLLEQIKKSTPHNVVLYWHLNSTVSHINLEKSIITIASATDTQEMGFHVLVNCEGEKRQTVNIINQETQKTADLIPPFTYQQLESLETYHMAIKIKIKDTDSETSSDLISHAKELYRKNKSLQEEVDAFVKSKVLINNHSIAIADLPFLFDPNTYKQKFYERRWVPKYFVAGMIPAELHLMPDSKEKRAVLLKWSSYLLAYNFQMAPESFVIDANDSEKTLQQRANTFTTNLMAVNDPVKVLPNKSVIVVLGDACMSPYYWEGISSTIGLNEAVSFLDCLFAENSATEDPYHKFKTLYKEYKSFIMECLADNAIEKTEAQEYTATP